ncbi:pyridoxamine 5'-phosphate oxidase family protein [Pseudactinotalea sp. Z1732]|uniref:pyridoxamine 5'-phosphate oxidase family protein n=1 Tax=Micrococcales TaxID=85006 RepID=UPI003C7BE176
MRGLRRRFFGRVGLLYRRWARRRMVTDPRAMVDRAWGIVRAKRYCLMITESPGGPVARVIEPVARAADGTLWFGTDPGSRKVSHIRRSARCLLVFQDDRRRACVTLECDAKIVGADAPIRFRHFFRAFWPGGPGPDYVNVVCTPTAMEIWDGLAVIAPEPFGRRQARLEFRDGRWELIPAPAPR